MEKTNIWNILRIIHYLLLKEKTQICFITTHFREGDSCSSWQQQYDVDENEMGFGNLVVNGCQSSVVGLINMNCMKFVFVMILSMEK